MKTKTQTAKEQKLNAELGLIIDEMGRAMWNANREYVARKSQCRHDLLINFTHNMYIAWMKYVIFCENHPNEKA